MNDLGIDISSYSGVWDAKKAYSNGIRWATIRASTGMNEDTLWKSHYDASVAAGIFPIAYHWLNPKLNILEQAKLFVRVVGTRYTPLMMIDLEDYVPTNPLYAIRSHKGIAAEIKNSFFPVVEATNRANIVYTNKDYSYNYFIQPRVSTPYAGDGDIFLRKYPLVVASFGGVAPTMPWPWEATQWLAWQHRVGKTEGKAYGLGGSWEAALYVWNGELPQNNTPFVFQNYGAS